MADSQTHHAHFIFIMGDNIYIFDRCTIHDDGRREIPYPYIPTP